MARAGRSIGVEADECLRRRCGAALVEVGRSSPDLRLFVDSGAFSEVAPGPSGMRVVKPISRAEWERRLAFMERIGRAWGPRLLVMAPDRIADQEETLRRLAWFRVSGWLDRIRATGAEIAVVLQGGELSPVAFDSAAKQALGWDGYAVAFPMKKGATPLPAIQAYVAAARPRRVHLLGIGPEARRERGKPSGNDVRRHLFAAFPEVVWSWDSNLIRRSVGRKGRTRTYTAAQDLERSEIEREALVGDIALARGPFSYDSTELALRPSLFLLDLWGWPALRSCLEDFDRARRTAETAEGRKRWRRAKARADRCRADFRRAAMATAREAGLTDDDAAAFVSDPDRFTQSGDRLMRDPIFEAALERAYAKWLRRSARQGGPPELAELLSERATYRAFRVDEPAEVEAVGQVQLRWW